MRVLLRLLPLIMISLLAACGRSGDGAPSTPAREANAEAVSEEHPLSLSREAGRVTVFARLNRAFTRQPTRHGLVFREGTLVEEALFTTPANMVDFHDALRTIGARRGSLGSDGRIRDGTRFRVTVTWDGAGTAYGLDDILTDTTGASPDITFSGSASAAKSYFTGCMMCLDSCDVGITSNAEHPKLITEQPDSHIRLQGNPDVLPADGTAVRISFTIIRPSTRHEKPADGN